MGEYLNYACRHHSHIFFYCVSKLRNLWESVQNRASHRWCGWWVRYRRWGPLLYGVRCAHRATRWSMFLHPWQECILLCCVYVCVRAVLMCMCVFCTCVCMWPYVRLCSFLTVCFTFFGNLFGISTNEAQFYWLF